MWFPLHLTSYVDCYIENGYPDSCLGHSGCVKAAKFALSLCESYQRGNLEHPAKVVSVHPERPREFTILPFFG